MNLFNKKSTRTGSKQRRSRRRVLENLELRQLMATDLEINNTFSPLPTETQEIAIVNGGFEDVTGMTTYNEFNFGSLPGWDVYDPSGVADGPGYFVGTLAPTEIAAQPGVTQYFADGAPEGNRVGIAFNYAFTADGGEYGMQQTLQTSLEADTTYTLSVDVGNIATGISVDGTTFNLDGLPGYRIDFVVGDTVVASDNNSLAGEIPEGEFVNSRVTFSASADDPLLGQAISVRLVNLNDSTDVPGGNDLEVDFDNVQLFATTLNEEQVETLPVLLVISNQDFWYQDYADAVSGLNAQGVDVVIAAATTDIATPQPGSGYGPDGGQVIPDIAVSDADSDDYSAILFSGGWGMSVYHNTDIVYNNPAYNGSAALRSAVNDLIIDFNDSEKFISGLCFGTTVLAHADLDGQSLLAGRNVTGWQWVAPGDDAAGPNTGRWHVESQGGVMAQSGAIGDPTTSADDVIIDGNIITGENMFTALYLGEVLGQQVNAAALDAAFAQFANE